MSNVDDAPIAVPVVNVHLDTIKKHLRSQIYTASNPVSPDSIYYLNRISCWFKYDLLQTTDELEHLEKEFPHIITTNVINTNHEHLNWIIRRGVYMKARYLVDMNLITAKYDTLTTALATGDSPLCLLLISKNVPLTDIRDYDYRSVTLVARHCQLPVMMAVFERLFTPPKPNARVQQRYVLRRLCERILSEILSRSDLCSGDKQDITIQLMSAHVPFHEFPDDWNRIIGQCAPVDIRDALWSHGAEHHNTIRSPLSYDAGVPRPSTPIEDEEDDDDARAPSPIGDNPTPCWVDTYSAWFYSIGIRLSADWLYMASAPVRITTVIRLVKMGKVSIDKSNLIDRALCTIGDLQFAQELHDMGFDAQNIYRIIRFFQKITNVTLPGKSINHDVKRMIWFFNTNVDRIIQLCSNHPTLLWSMHWKNIKMYYLLWSQAPLKLKRHFNNVEYV